MILPSAVREFVERHRQNYDRYKRFSAAKLQRLCDRLPVKPPIWYKLNWEQKICFLIGVKEKDFMFMLDTGMGKTLLSIALHRYFLRLWKRSYHHGLVLVPNKVNKYEWAREVKKHSKSTIIVLQGSSRNKWQQFEENDSDLYVTTFGGLMRMVTMLKEHGRKKKNKLVINDALVRRLTKKINGLFVDESTLAKNKAKLPYRICRRIAKQARVVFMLTGTPFGDDPEDLWSQMFLVDWGYTLGETLGLYRAEFFVEKQNFFTKFPEYKFNKKKAAQLHEFIKNKAIQFEVDEADLPDVVQIDRIIQLPTDAQSYYDVAKKRLQAAHGNFKEQTNAFLRMLQISSGFIGYDDDETGAKAKFAFKPNRKLEMLMADIETVRSKHKGIIFHNFIYSGDQIEAALKKAGYGYLRIGGGSKDDPEETLNRFDRSKKHQFLILGNDAGGYGLNLQVAKYGFRYEIPVGALLEKQAKRRFIRQHSPHKSVFLYDYVVAGTKDAALRINHRRAGKLFDAIIWGR